MMPTKEDDLNLINNNINTNNNHISNPISTMNNNNGPTSNFCGNDSVDLNNMNNNNNNNNDNGNTRIQNTTGMSKAELRKSNKPIMEKRRRARINHCLNELKTLILEAMKKDPARHTKLEKADILEMTVKHLQSIQRQQLSLAIQTDPTVIHKFKSGFVECAEEVNRYISQLDGIDQNVRQRLANHLNNCATGLEQLGTFSNFSSAATSYRPPTNTSTLTAPYNVGNTVFPTLPQDVNNNGRIQMGGVQLIPSRLPSGEIALIMPNTNNVPFFLPNFQPNNFDFTNTFTRLSAFSKPTSTSSPSVSTTISTSSTGFSGNYVNNVGGLVGRPSATQTTTTTTTPPLSPVSSVSSVGDDSMHTSSDFNQSKTPPPSLNHSFSNIFPTPPSGHLQQPHVSSTSESNQNFVKVEADESIISRKRRSCPEDSSDSSEEPTSKHFKIESIDDPNGNTITPKQNSNIADGPNEHMWRPW